jgi:hypothetical protein
MVATAMRIVNAVPATCAAPPGLVRRPRPAAHAARPPVPPGVTRSS